MQLECYEGISTLGDVPDFHAGRSPDAIALMYDARCVTYAELAMLSNRVAHGLLGLGLEPGARVAFLGHDSEVSYEILFGCAKARFVMLSVNWKLEEREITYIVHDSDAEVLFVTDAFEAIAAAVCEQCPRVKTVIHIGSSSEGALEYVSWRDEQSSAPLDRRSHRLDAVLQVYTSGTSGRAKGVVLTHAGFIDLCRDVECAGDEFLGWKDGDITLLTLPTYHVGGLWWAIHGLIHRARNVVMRTFIAAEVLRLIEAHRITKLAFVPAMLRFVLADPTCRSTDLSSVDFIIYGGSPMPAPLLREARLLFRCRLAQNYGLSETTNMAVFMPPSLHDEGSNRPSAAGKPLRGVQVRILGPNGQVMPTGQTGEIAFKTPSRMLEYWKLPEESARTLVDGWIHTGDAGFIDADGFVCITDRIKDLVISAGENIYPAEIERILLSHADIQEAAVIGIPHDDWGEVPIAFIVKRPGSTLSKSDISKFARERIASFKLPRKFEIVESLPRSPIGKVLKRALREPYWAGRARGVH